MEKKQVCITILLITLIICILPSFLASSNPDGLEASAEIINPDVLELDQLITH